LTTLSVCIVTKDEELNIEETLKTVTFADEIIVVDSHSTDNTVKICKQYTNKIYTNLWQGCGIQKKFALEKASCDWVLILDADERLSVELQKEIQTVIKEKHRYSGFIIPFQTFYLGKAIKYGDWYNEQHLRLFKRNQGQIIAHYVHFGLEVTGNIGKLRNRISHNSFPNVESILNKANMYSTLGAKDKLKAGKTANIFTAILHGIFTFIRGYIFRLGFLDGKYGFMLAISNAQGSYYKYIKLMFLSLNQQQFPN
jgi:glycosyltransferase involved in cell wall biosynthesis